MSKKRNDSYFAAERRRKRKTMMIITPIIIAVVAAGVAVALLYKPAPALAIDGVECHSAEANQYHFHAHLSVFVNGQEQQVPGSIGIVSTPYSCFYWLHTHTSDGILHMEAPRAMPFTLGQFINIWQQTKSDSQSFFSTIAGMPVKAYVNGNEFNGDPKGIQLQS
ncbi:MAG TPA: hypothetical protein VHK86_01795, partial [Nitrososphaera sp.]|nr:hypothetical protein [Nitrososphaera sp.]